MKIIKVSYECIGCSVNCVTTNHNLRYRKHHKNEYYCQKCLIKLEKSFQVFFALPVEYHQQIFLGCVDYDLAVKYLKHVKTKIRVKFRCEECSKLCEIRWSKLSERKNNKFDRLCGRCLQSKLNTTEQAIDKHRKRAELLWKDNSYREKCLKAFESHNRSMQLDVEYAARHKRRSIDGEIEIDGRSIRFDSAFELIFIDYIYHKCKIIRRCNHAIMYGSHFYHPDFFIVLLSGKRVIVEIKGYYRDMVYEKQVAAIRYIKETGVADDYVLYDTDLLLSEGILKGRGGTCMWKQIRKINNDRNVTFTDQKHRRIAEVGYSRYRKESKNQKDF